MFGVHGEGRIYVSSKAHADTLKWWNLFCVAFDAIAKSPAKKKSNVFPDLGLQVIVRFLAMAHDNHQASHTPVRRWTWIGLKSISLYLLLSFFIFKYAFFSLFAYIPFLFCFVFYLFLYIYLFCIPFCVLFELAPVHVYARFCFMVLFSNNFFISTFVFFSFLPACFFIHCFAKIVCPEEALPPALGMFNYNVESPRHTIMNFMASPTGKNPHRNKANKYPWEYREKLHFSPGVGECVCSISSLPLSSVHCHYFNIQMWFPC